MSEIQCTCMHICFFHGREENLECFILRSVQYIVLITLLKCVTQFVHVHVHVHVHMSIINKIS